MKDIEGYQGLYAITEDGRVWSYPKHFKKGHFMDLNTPSTRYLYAQLWNGKTGKHFFIHRLVALTYLPNPFNLPQVNHKNGNKRDNRVENLEWITAEDNIKHAKTKGLFLRGSSNPSSKLNEEMVLNIIERRKKKETLEGIALCFNVSKQLIWQISTGRAWKYLHTKQVMDKLH